MREEIQKLKDWNCDTKSALERFVDDEEFYLDMFVKYQRKLSVDELRTRIMNHQIEEAFTCAHDIKGVAGNLGITPLYEIICKIVEPLRGGSDENLLPLVDELERRIREMNSRFGDFQLSNEKK